MDKLWFLFYNVLILPLFKISVNILSLINRKIRIGLKERDNLFDKLKIDLDKLDPSKKILWFHSSSSGEFEQAKPIIEEINKTNQLNIVASFFSPNV
ncbi:MAG: glycosyltransferase N-terminal domain-containing protein [Anaerolineae bacterium]